MSLFSLLAVGPSTVSTMDGAHCCTDCGVTLQVDDGHDLCPACLGQNYLVENPCMNCSDMPCSVRVARLAQLHQSLAMTFCLLGRWPGLGAQNYGIRLVSVAPPNKR